MILIIDTSSSGISLLLDNKYKFVESEKQSLSLPVETEKFLKENNAKFSDLTAIGVVVGPGSFTGIRLGIAYAKGLAMGLGISVVPVNAFEIYLQSAPDAFVAIDSKKGDFFVGAKDLQPQIMSIEQVETKQFDYAKTTGHKPYDLLDACKIVEQKLKAELQPVIPLYIRASYAEQNCKPS